MFGSAVCAFAHAFAPTNPCASCHPHEVAGYQRTAMAHSLSHVAPQAKGTFTHGLSATTFVIQPHEGRTEVVMKRDNMTATYPITYVIGSGSHAFGYLTEADHHLFQAPISYYTKRKSWDMAPGYETDAAPDFFRPVTAECLQCHAGRPHPIAGTLNQYNPMDAAEEAISCERCHGDATAHLQRPNRETIANPLRLSQRARDSVCEQCHLSGEARILNPGRQFGDFQPGQNLEDVFTVYVRDHSTARPSSSIKVISHAEQLALSRCARQSEGKLWCGTCHDPHEQPAEPVAYFRAKCLSCHGQAIAQKHTKPADNCIGCHMPKRPTTDGAHTVFTDHEIARFPAPRDQSPSAAAPMKLRPWHEPAAALATRNLGLANVAVGERTQSSELIDEGAGQLIAAMKDLPPDPVLLTKLGFVFLRKGFASDATEFLAYALKLQPSEASAHANLGVAYKEQGEAEKAITELDQAIELDPALETAYRSLGEIYLSQQNFPELRRTLERYLKAMPNNLQAMKALDDLNSKFHSH